MEDSTTTRLGPPDKVRGQVSSHGPSPGLFPSGSLVHRGNCTVVPQNLPGSFKILLRYRPTQTSCCSTEIDHPPWRLVVRVCYPQVFYPADTPQCLLSYGPPGLLASWSTARSPVRRRPPYVPESRKHDEVRFGKPKPRLCVITDFSTDAKRGTRESTEF